MKTIVSSIIFAVWLAIGSNAVAVSGVAIVAATGGSAISADTTGGTYTTLVGPTITESNPGGIGTGTIILTAPTGFIFNTSSAVTVTLTHTGSGTGDMVLASTTAVVSSTTITITVNTQTTGSRLAKLALSGIQVRPTAGAPLATGNITKSGTAAYSETGSVGNYGTLTETVGAVSKLVTTLPGQTFTSGVGNSGTVSTQTAGTAFNISRLTATDQFTNLVTTYTGAKTISYTGPSGTTLYTTAVTFSSGVSTTTLSTTLRTAETTTITASATGLTGIPSSPLTVSPGATATRLQILLPGETAVPGTSTGKTGTPTTIAAQTPISATVNLTDTNWNVVSSSDTVHLTSSDSVAVLPANGSLISGTGSFSVTLKTRTNSTISVSDVTNGTVTSGTSAAITVTNNLPVLSSINDLTGALEDTTFTISYATLLAQSDLTDIDVNAVDVLSFRVAAISSGTLTQSGTNVVAGSTFLTPTSAAFVWRAATNVNGTLNAFTVRGYDGTAFSTSTVQVRSVVTAINDVPSFTKGANQTGLEDSAARTVSNWATSISTGPADEATQTIAFIVSNNNSNLFSVQPAVSSSGTLTYTLAANANGTATVSVAAQDNGGILNGGLDTSAAQTFTVTITGVNDAPSFTKGSDITLDEDAGAQSFSGWATAISAGPSDEIAQTLTFTTSNNNSNLFSVQPTLSTNGTLSVTPSSNTNGSATVTVTLRDNGGTTNNGIDTSASQTFVITVNPVNDAPTLNALSDLSVLEDAATQIVTLAGISTGPNEASQTLNFSASSSDSNVISSLSITYTSGSTGTLRYTPVTNANGTATITVTAQDNGGIANSGIDTITRSFTVTVTAVNDQPTLNTIGNVSVYEGSGIQTISLSGIGVGPTNETSQSITNFTAVSSNTNLVANPSVAYVSGSSGTLTYSAPVAGTGTGTATITVTAQDDGGTANAGANAVTRTFTVTVMQINHAPTIDTIADRSMLEGAGAQTITLTGISTGLSESGDSLTNFIATSSNTNLICNPTIRYTNGYSTAILSFTPRTNANGTATITVSLQDDGGTANSGIDTTTRSFNVTVTAVNDLPSFSKGTNVLLRTTTTAQTIANWASSIAAGPTNESAQSLSFHVSNDNNAMFSVQPSVSTNGTLTFTASGNGTANVSIYLQDDGGTANGGSDTSATQTFSITVYPINIAPSFAMSTNLTILEDAGVQVLTNWATNIVAGPTDEAAQTLSVSVTNDNSSLFAVQPSLSTNGVLTFTPADDAFGSAVVTVVLQDDGGTTYNGVDSSTQTFVLNITPINDAPSFTKGLDINLDITAPRYQAISGWANNISAGAKESSQTVTFILTNDSPAQFAQQPTISADGTLTFEIASAASNVLATVSVYITDNGGVDHQGTNRSATQIFHLSLSSSYGTPNILAAGQGPTGLYLGNLRGLTFEGATKSSGPRYRDMIIANSLENTVSVRFCNDDGTFTPATSYPVGLSPFGVISGDFDRDGYEEIVTANSGTNTISVLKNNIDRTFAPAVDYQIGSSSNPEPIAVMVGDFNGDGRLDIVVANRRDNSVSVLLGLGNSTFGSCTNFPVGSSPMSVWTGDLNGDKKLDIITSDKDGNTLTILPGLGNGSFGTAQTITLNGNPQPTYAITYDLNGDGKLDIVVANYASNTVSVLLKQADGSFQVSSNYSVGINPRSVLARDLDRDGKIDIACANNGSASVSILRNRGDGTFDYAGNFPAGGNPLIVWASNFDDDDASDIAISNYGDNTISILRYAGPLAYASQLSLLEDHSVAVTLKGRILSGSTLTYQIATNPAHGTLSGTAPNLVYTPDTNYYGTDVFSYQVTYTGGDLILNSAKATVTLKISPVNDAPLFSLSAGALSLTNFNTLQTLSGFASGISAGSVEERLQQLTFTVTTTNKTLFDIQPKLSSDGTLTFRPALNKEGVAIVSVRLTDNGGTLNGGTNGTAIQTFTITVLPNPVMRLKGTYNGLFYETAGAQNASSGFISLSLTDKRTFSGKLLLTGKTYSLVGTLNTNGLVQLTIPRTNQNSLTVTFFFDLAGGDNDQINGTVTDGTWNSVFLGDRNVFNALTNPASCAGRYTLAFGGNPGNAYKPAGDGFGLITAKTDGSVALTGMMADGTAITQSTYVSKNGIWPFYASLYNGTGVILGWMSFTNTIDSNIEGDISWIKTAGAGGKYYPAGFTNEIVAVGSTFTVPSTGTRVLALTNAVVELRDGNLPRSFTNQLTLKTNNTFSVTLPNTNSLSLTVASTTGVVSGGAINPQTKARVAIRGVILQKQNGAYGFFLGTNQSGLFLLHP